MTVIAHTVPHDVGRDLAKKATVAAMDSYSDKYGAYSPKTTWTGDYTATVAFHVKGLSLDGKIEVREREIALSMDVPFLLRPFKARALSIIEREIGAWMQRAKNGEFS
jgi:hypothetical protein